MKKKEFRCDSHGSEEWKFTIICSKCGAVYQAVAEGTEFVPICPGAKRAPETCECGARLPGKEGTARAICTKCFIQRVAS